MILNSSTFFREQQKPKRNPVFAVKPIKRLETFVFNHNTKGSVNFVIDYADILSFSLETFGFFDLQLQTLFQGGRWYEVKSL